MSERELAQLFGNATRDLDARQRARIRQLRGLERILFDAMARKIADELDAGRGVIRTGRGSASINRLVDVVFNAMERDGIRGFYKDSTKDLFGILGNNEAYNYALFGTISKAGDARFKAMRKQVDGIMRRRIGLDIAGRIKEGGMLSRLFTTEAIRTSVKELVNAGAASGVPIGKLTRQVEVLVKGTREVPGVFQRQFQPVVFDTYQAFDRASNKVYADKLQLDTFIYAGGLIETSREFCRKRNAKVFTLEEAAKWSQDPDLPKKSSERASGVITGYDPTVDLGRWNCRHRTRFISRPLAEQLRPDLKKV